jgi:catechol 2,3-dioxygenase-like lactoylglutathione lyase family enzyme
MRQHLNAMALLVKDYDEAIEYFTRILCFQLIEDTQLTAEKRWVVVAPPGSGNGCKILLAKAANERQLSAVGNQCGGRVFLFLHTDDFERDYQRMKKAGVDFLEEPREEVYGRVAVFQDLYGNRWDLIEPNH